MHSPMNAQVTIVAAHALHGTIELYAIRRPRFLLARSFATHRLAKRPPICVARPLSCELGCSAYFLDPLLERHATIAHRAPPDLQLLLRVCGQLFGRRALYFESLACDLLAHFSLLEDRGQLTI